MPDSKPWSFSTTVRSPERIRDFLKILQLLKGEEWDDFNQTKYQILLIQHKLYGYGSSQFYNTLSKKQVELMKTPDPIDFEEAQNIFNSKDYEDPPMRGRQSITPLKKMGLAYIDSEKTIQISSLGHYFLQDDYDIGEVFFRYFLKWQYPNPVESNFTSNMGFDINPFLCSMHLIDRVNILWTDLGYKPVGVSKEEFCLFFPTLINYLNISDYAKEIVHYRLELKKRSKGDLYSFRGKYRFDFVGSFFQTENHDIIKKKLKNLGDYGDNTIRYFRLTRYFRLRGEDRYVDLEPRRSIEIKALLSKFDGSANNFTSKQEYLDYLFNIDLPYLPWLTIESLSSIAKQIIDELKELQKEIVLFGGIFPKIKVADISKFSEKGLKDYIEKLRSHRRKLQFTLNHFESQKIDKIKHYIDALRNLRKLPEKNSILLEKYITMAFNALNDAKEIHPNYPLGDDNEPIFTAGAGVPDIECYYNSFDSICEVTMLTARNQWYNEGQPVMRHLRNFEDKINSDRDIFCIFIAPSIHQDTANTFWVSVKYEYQGAPQKIVPLKVSQIIELLEFLIEYKEQGKLFLHTHLKELFERIVSIKDKVNSSKEWLSQIPNIIKDWKDVLLNES
ncbi:AlwI family type II restriction endonuclease [Candidatus Dependentiae bacterium]|nr:AlwI family type II restriction endonuclease [Candidatus Dependentiae bacterium]